MFDASVGPPFTTGVFVSNGKTISMIALGANPDPAAPSFGTVSDAFITSNSEVVFDVNNIDSFRSDGKTIIPLVREGDSAPGGGILMLKLLRNCNRRTDQCARGSIRDLRTNVSGRSMWA